MTILPRNPPRSQGSSATGEAVSQRRKQRFTGRYPGQGRKANKEATDPYSQMMLPITTASGEVHDLLEFVQCRCDPS